MPQDSIFTIESNGKVYKIQAPSDSTEAQLQLAIAGHNSSNLSSAPDVGRTESTRTGSTYQPQQSLTDTAIGIAKGIITGTPTVSGQAVLSYFKSGSINDKLKDLSDLTQHAAAAAVGGAATLGSGPVGGSFAMSGTEAVLNKIKGQAQDQGITGNLLPGNKDSSIRSTIIGGLENEVTGKVISGVGGKVLGAAEEAFNPGSISGIKDNTRSFSQLAEKGKRYYSRILEDIFAPSEKQAATEATNKVLQKNLESEVSNLSGGRPIDLSSKSVDTTRGLAEDIQSGVKNHFELSSKVSDAKASTIDVIAKQNNPAKLTTAIAISGTVSNIPNVDGPILAKDGLEAANRYLKSSVGDIVGKDPTSPIVKAAENMITSANAVFDANGNLIKADPVSFQQAWQWKKSAGNLAFGSPTSEIGAGDVKFSSIYHALDNDIENSIPHWPHNGQKALDLWHDTKQIVANKYEQFAPQGELGAKVKDLLNAKDTQIDKLDEIIKDPSKLQRLLNTGDIIQVLTGSKNTPVSSVANTGTKKALKGYALSRIWQNGNSLNADGVAVPDPRKMYQLWQDAEKTTSMRMIYSAADRAQIGMFFKDLANVNQKMQGGGSMYLKIRGAVAGLSLATGLTQSLLSHGSVLPLSSGEVIGGGISGAIIGAHQLGLLLTNKNTARIMQGMAQNRLDVPAQFASRMIATVLRGQKIKLQKSDGSTIEGQIKK